MKAVSRTMFEFDDTKIESGAKLIVAIAAAWAIVMKLCAPICRWCRNWLKTGSRIDELIKLVERELAPNGTPLCSKIADIQSHVKILSAKEQLRFENSPIPSYECDATGACTAVNPAWCQLFGVTEHHMLGNGWLDVIHNPAERERVLENWQQSVKNRYPHREQYMATNGKTGDILWCQSATIECADKAGKPIIYCGTIKVCGPNWTPL